MNPFQVRVSKTSEVNGLGLVKQGIEGYINLKGWVEFVGS